MKRFPRLFNLLACLALAFACNTTDPDPKPTPGPDPDPTPGPVVPTGTGESGITYQLLVYSFCDSDGDGCGDFKGIESKLDYLKEMGVQALWLSPIHPAASYHGYDVLDYYAVNPDYGSESDFQSLLSAAHAKGIKIYLDYVLNHTGKDHPWFLQGKADPASKYRGYYHFSTTPKSGYASTTAGDDPGKINVKFTIKASSATSPQSLTAEKVESAADEGTGSSGIYLWYGSVTDDTMPEFHPAGNGTYTLTVKDFQSDWGVLVRTSKTAWDSYKFGAASSNDRTIVWGVPLKLKSNSDIDIYMPWMTSIYYQSVFGNGYMPDLNYGAASSCENSEAFKDVCAAADKWIKMGVDGFRLDAVKHIYDNDKSDENPTFLKKFYDHCNATYKSTGKSGNIYMVGEQFSNGDEVAPYYKGLPAFFEFSFWWEFKNALNKADGLNGSSFSRKIEGYRSKYKGVRSDFIAATKLSNHDEDRTGSDLNKQQAKMKLAGAVLLTYSGEPYIYQGEELGYWGTKGSGDEYVRTPVMWTGSLSSAASAKLGGKLDKSMLTSAISVESQANNESSMLSTYRKFGKLRDAYPALAKGSLSAVLTSNNDVAAWYREYNGQKILVLHNFGGGNSIVTLSGDKLTEMIGSNGSVTVKDSKLTLGAYASALFLQ